MNLQALVNHTRCNILRDTAVPQLWTDPEIVRYLNQAEKEFATRTHDIVDDSTPGITSFTTVIGQQVYPLHKSILLVYEAGLVEYDTSGDEPVEIAYCTLRDRTRNQLRRRFATGRPSLYTAQVRTQSLRLDPTPDAVYTIEMVVARKPRLEMSQAMHVPEITEDYHLNLCDFAAFRCLSNNKPEGADMAAAKDFRDLWDLGVRDAKRMIARQRAGETAMARSNWTGKRYRAHA